MKIGDHIYCENCGTSVAVEAPPAGLLPIVDEIESNCPVCGEEIGAYIERADDTPSLEDNWYVAPHTHGISAGEY